MCIYFILNCDELRVRFIVFAIISRLYNISAVSGTNGCVLGLDAVYYYYYYNDVCNVTCEFFDEDVFFIATDNPFTHASFI